MIPAKPIRCALSPVVDGAYRCYREGEEHCFAIAMETRGGWKIAYGSGAIGEVKGETLDHLKTALLHSGQTATFAMPDPRPMKKATPDSVVP